MSTVVVLGAGVCQVDLINYVANKYNTLVIAPNRPIYVRHNFQWICHDACDITGIYNIIRESDLHVDVVISDQSDHLIAAVSKLSAKLGLRSVPVDSVPYFVNKQRVYELAKSLCIPVPEVFNTLEDIEFPCVKKPMVGASSVGVEIINSLENVNTTDIYQQYVTGTEVTVEGMVINNNYIPLTISRKDHCRFGVANQLIYNHDYGNKYSKILHDYTKLYTENVRPGSCLVHAEYIVDPTETPVLVDIACRGGGCNIHSRVVRELTGINVYEALINNMLDIDYKYITTSTDIKVEMMFPEIVKHSTDSGWSNINEQIIGIENVLDYRLCYDIEKPLPVVSNDSTRHLLVTIKYANYHERECILNNIFRLFEVNNVNLSYETRNNKSYRTE